MTSYYIICSLSEEKSHTYITCQTLKKHDFHLRGSLKYLQGFTQYLLGIFVVSNWAFKWHLLDFYMVFLCSFSLQKIHHSKSSASFANEQKIEFRCHLD